MSFLRIAVIMAGGSGERFWPLSNAKRPKQLLRLTHPEQTLLEEACTRISGLIPNDRVFVATTRLLEGEIQDASCVQAGNVIAEPEKRNTLGCLCWVAANFIARHPNESLSLAILTADHKMGNVAKFRETVKKAMVTAEQTDALVTIGINAIRPETGYGYIQIPEGADLAEPQRAVAFHEKPNVENAKEYVASGHYLWNSGMFFWTLSSFLRELQSAQPEVHDLVLRMAEALKERRIRVADELFQELPSQSIDTALMEKAENVYVVPGDFPWDDVGSWDSLDRSFERNAEGNIIQGKVVTIDSNDCILVNESRHKVGVLGVSDLVIVVSQDGILVCHKDRAQEVKKISAALENQ